MKLMGGGALVKSSECVITIASDMDVSKLISVLGHISGT